MVKGILRLLSEYQPSPEELLFASTIKAFVESHPDCCERSLLEGHLTASAWIVDPMRSATILVHHRKLGRWIQPGGHADGETDLELVARKEAFEETGVENLVAACPGIFDLDIHEIPARENVPAHLHYDIRFAFVADAPILKQNHESLKIAWVPIATLHEYTSERSVLRMGEKTARRLLKLT